MNSLKSFARRLLSDIRGDIPSGVLWVALACGGGAIAYRAFQPQLVTGANNAGAAVVVTQ